MRNHLKTARFVAKLLDSQFRLFGVKFGIEPIIGLVPGWGDLISLILSAYLLWIGYKTGLPSKKMYRMAMNIVIDFVLGLVPIVGDITDVFFKANLKNLKILEQYATIFE